ncbi:MAG: heterodisulfide reductase-related iron-sulfur binding cluster [Enterobacterales bacterium]|nr:heterodisulfide reductase-related iron-sulfur binding cluster [Enterobacterales bacterium]
MSEGKKEGGLSAPTRHPIDWQSDDFYDEESLNKELYRVFDICHGCRRCVSLCDSFPTLFDLVDESKTMEMDGVDTKDYHKVVDQCFLCDLCYMTKCPYVPPHEWNLDFPHLMLRAKAQEFKKGQTPLHRKVLTSTTSVGKVATIPVVVNMVNAVNQSKLGRKLVDKILHVDQQAHLPPYEKLKPAEDETVEEAIHQVAIFATCYGEYNEPAIVEALEDVLRHNQAQVKRVKTPACCGMPKLELGDLDSAVDYWKKNKSTLLPLAKAGWKITSPVPSCVLMFKQELPLLLPDDRGLKIVAEAFVDPFEFLWGLQKNNQLKTDFSGEFGTIFYHQPCHQRVQNFGNRTQDILSLIPHEKIDKIARCSGHDGTYGVRKETFAKAKKIARPIVRKVGQSKPDSITSDCPMAASHIANLADAPEKSIHPLVLLKQAYGI